MRLNRWKTIPVAFALVIGSTLAIPSSASADSGVTVTATGTYSQTGVPFQSDFSFVFDISGVVVHETNTGLPVSVPATDNFQLHICGQLTAGGCSGCQAGLFVGNQSYNGLCLGSNGMRQYGDDVVFNFSPGYYGQTFSGTLVVEEHGPSPGSGTLDATGTFSF